MSRNMSHVTGTARKKSPAQQMKENRRIAIGAAASIIRKRGELPKDITPEDALCIIDDLSRTEPDLLASFWYKTATQGNLRLFKEEWVKRFKFQSF